MEHMKNPYVKKYCMVQIKESKREWLNLSRYNQIIPACVFKTNFMSQVRAWNGKVKWCISFRNINWGQKRSKVMTNKYKTTFEYLFDQFLWDRDWASQIIARIVIFSIHQPENSGLPDWIVLLHQHLFNGFFQEYPIKNDTYNLVTLASKFSK